MIITVKTAADKQELCEMLDVLTHYCIKHSDDEIADKVQNVNIVVEGE